MTAPPPASLRRFRQRLQRESWPGPTANGQSSDVPGLTLGPIVGRYGGCSSISGSSPSSCGIMTAWPSPSTSSSRSVWCSVPWGRPASPNSSACSHRRHPRPMTAVAVHPDQSRLVDDAAEPAALDALDLGVPAAGVDPGADRGRPQHGRRTDRARRLPVVAVDRSCGRTHLQRLRYVDRAPTAILFPAA